MNKWVSCLALCLAVLLAACDGPAAPEPPDPSTFPKPRDVAEEDYVVFPTGLKYYDFIEGTGEAVKNGDQVAVHYHGWLMSDSTLFDTSYNREEPIDLLSGRAW